MSDKFFNYYEIKESNRTLSKLLEIAKKEINTFKSLKKERINVLSI